MERIFQIQSMTGNTKEPSINLIKGSFVLLFKERAPIALPSILISKIEDKCLLNVRQISYTASISTIHINVNSHSMLAFGLAY